MTKPKVHYPDVRLGNNAGIDMAVCYANRNGPLDLNKTGLLLTTDKSKVTCKNCPRVFIKRYPWAMW